MATYRWPHMLTMQLFIQPDYYGYTGMGNASHSNCELAVESLLCMGGHARHLPEANLTIVHFYLCHSQPDLSHDRHTHSIHSLESISFHVCSQHIQLELSSLLLSFIPMLQSGSSPSCSFSWLSWSTHRCGHSIIMKYLNPLIYGQSNKHTNMCAQCSHTSVGLVQARPNNPVHTKLYNCPLRVITAMIPVKLNVIFVCVQIYIPWPATVTILATLTILPYYIKIV